MSCFQSFWLCLAHALYIYVFSGPYGVTFYDILQWLIFMFCITCSDNKDMSLILYLHNLRYCAIVLPSIFPVL